MKGDKIMMKTTHGKKICFVLVLVIMMSCLSVNVFAVGETKTVSYTDIYFCIGTVDQAFSYVSSMGNYPVFYDDGEYRGNLYIVRYQLQNRTYLGYPYPDGFAAWEFELYISGTVTRYN